MMSAHTTINASQTSAMSTTIQQWPEPTDNNYCDQAKKSDKQSATNSDKKIEIKKKCEELTDCTFWIAGNQPMCAVAGSYCSSLKKDQILKNLFKDPVFYGGDKNLNAGCHNVGTPCVPRFRPNPDTKYVINSQGLCQPDYINLNTSPRISCPRPLLVMPDGSDACPINEEPAKFCSSFKNLELNLKYYAGDPIWEYSYNSTPPGCYKYDDFIERRGDKAVNCHENISSNTLVCKYTCLEAARPGQYCPESDDPFDKPVVCPAGYYTDKPGQSSCTQCQAGTFSPPGSTSPEDCVP